MNKKFITISILLALIFVFIIFEVVQHDSKQKSDEIKSAENNFYKNPTNPAYQNNKALIFIDEKNTISDLPEDNKPVWVEKVINENTVAVSYVISKGGENFITFSKIKIRGLADLTLNPCQEEEAVFFIKNFIENKFVYLYDHYLPILNQESGLSQIEEDLRKKTKQSDNLILPQYDPKYLSKNIKIPKNNISITLIPKEEYENDDYVDLSQVIVFSGFGLSSNSYLSGQINNELKGMQEVAEVTKRGFWKSCGEI